MSKHKLLLHVCCGPCSTHCIKELQKQYNVTLYFCNPNIHPFHEYSRRLETAEKVAQKLNVPLIEAGYDPENWIKEIKGLEEEPEGGRRCTVCFNIRLDRTARYAKANNFDCFTTTMTISPHKDAKRINESGEHHAEKNNIEWIHSDFKKGDGFKKSADMSKELNLYRQNYCGCFYSLTSRRAPRKHHLDIHNERKNNRKRESR